MDFEYKRKTGYLPDYKVYLIVYNLDSKNIKCKYILGFKYRDIIKYLYNNKVCVAVCDFLYVSIIYNKFFLLLGVNYCKIYIKINIY